MIDNEERGGLSLVGIATLQDTQNVPSLRAIHNSGVQYLLGHIPFRTNKGIYNNIWKLGFL